MALTAKKVYAILKRQISDMEAKIKTPIIYRGTVATADLLPLNPSIGDMYNIEQKSIYGEAGMNVAWNGVVWDTMGAPIDMSLYIKSDELADWVKQQNKPTYTAEEVGALPADTKIPSKTSDLQNDSGFLTKIPDNYLSGTDKTLSVSGKAADAKTVGDKNVELLDNILSKLDKNQGSENSGKIAGINESGDIVPMFPVGVEYNSETNCLEFGSDQKMELNQGIGLDSTLTKTGFAADAGTVGKITNSLKEDLVKEVDYRDSLAKSMGSELKHGINLFDSSELENKKFSDIAIDDPNGRYAWIYQTVGTICRDINVGEIVSLKAFDNTNTLIDESVFTFNIIDKQGSIIKQLLNGHRETLNINIPKGSMLQIILSKNKPHDKNIIFSGIVLLTQKFNGILQKFEPEVNEYIPFEEYYTNTNNTVYIGKGTNFPKIKDGLAYAVENNLIVIIKPGIYDLVSEGINGEGNKLPKHLIGYGVTLKADLPTENWDWSPLNVDMKRDETIVEGLTIEVSNCRYCIHDEMYNRSEPYHNVFKNLRLVHKTGASSVLIAPHCIGGGLGNGGIIEIENVIVNANLYKDISYHSCAGTPTLVSRVFIKDSIVKHCVEVSRAGTGDSFVNKVYVSNCVLGRQPLTDVDKNIQIVAWNNIIDADVDTN